MLLTLVFTQTLGSHCRQELFTHNQSHESALAQLQKPVFPGVSGAGSDLQHSSRDRTGEIQGAGLMN